MSDEQKIRELVRAWLAATKEGDIATVLDLMADDVVFMVPGKEPFGKEEFAEAAKRMEDVAIDSRSNIQELIIAGDWAWMRNRLEVTVTPPQGNAMQRSGYTLTILRKNRDGNWVVARDANLMMP